MKLLSSDRVLTCPGQSISSIPFLTLLLLCTCWWTSCKQDPEPEPGLFGTTIVLMDGSPVDADTLDQVSRQPIFQIGFTEPIDTNTLRNAVRFLAGDTEAPFSWQMNNGLVQISPLLTAGATYQWTISNELRSSSGHSFSGLELVLNVENGQITLTGLNSGTQSLLRTGRVTEIPLQPVLHFTFSESVDEQVAEVIRVYSRDGVKPFQFALNDDQKSGTITFSSPLSYLDRYTFQINNGYSHAGNDLAGVQRVFYTAHDSTFKFPEISDEELLTLVQRQTFRYFWDHAAPNSGLARERNNSGNTVTSGGSGFGIMALIVGVERGFISRDQLLERMEKILSYLETADRFHGAYAHWMDDSNGRALPFSQKDDGADLVETSFLFQGLLTMRQYLDATATREANLITRINTLWQAVEWDWFTRDGQNVLYWHWSPNYEWEMNFALRGYYEATITYVLAAASPTHTIDAAAYHEGWMRSGAVKNGKTFYGHTLPLGYDYGGPLFFAHYSFLGLDPRNLADDYAHYWEQNVAHSRINYEHCIRNPRAHAGYNTTTWGLTASDEPGGYSAHEPTNDNGTITPTAALGSMPYTPEESMRALRYFYYILGDRLWGDLGFYDAYNVNEGWWASSTLAIDQGPIIVMIENHRTGLLWDLFMTAPEIQTGLQKLGITYE